MIVVHPYLWSMKEKTAIVVADLFIRIYFEGIKLATPVHDVHFSTSHLECSKNWIENYCFHSKSQSPESYFSQDRKA